MTPLFDRLDLAPDAVFLLWVAGLMFVGAAVCGVIIAVGWVIWLRATRDRRPMNDKIITDMIFGRPTRPRREMSFTEFWDTVYRRSEKRRR